MRNICPIENKMSEDNFVAIVRICRVHLAAHYMAHLAAAF